MAASSPQSLWNAATMRLLERAYLDAGDERGRAGFGGDPARWRRAREVVVDAVHADGTFLDVGCAGGLLLASVREWAAERGLDVEPYGLELSAALADSARAAYPRWADRVFTGDVMTWQPPRLFDVVRIELLYAPPAGRPALVARCLDTLVAPGGRLAVCAYGSDRGGPPPDDVAALLAGWGLQVAGSARALGEGGRPLTHVAWVERGA